jgi:hypothetical protein
MQQPIELPRFCKHHLRIINPNVKAQLKLRPLSVGHLMLPSGIYRNLYSAAVEVVPMDQETWEDSLFWVSIISR